MRYQLTDDEILKHSVTIRLSDNDIKALMRWYSQANNRRKGSTGRMIISALRHLIPSIRP